MLLESERPAFLKYQDMKRTFNALPVIRFAVRQGFAESESSASEAMDGVLQWLACHTVREHAGKPFVMMNGAVDEMYHALMLNTRTYLHFCRDYVGFFIHHTPIDDVQADEIRLVGGISYTVGFLQEQFGPELSPSLREWVDQFERGMLTATSVSCVDNVEDVTPDRLLGISDFRSFWDRESAVSGRA